MLRTSLYFLFIALFCLFFADIEITTLDPWIEINSMLKGAITPDFSSLYTIKSAFLNTVVFALCSIFLGAVSGIFLTYFFRFKLVRLFCAVIRAVHEIFWAFILMPIIGLNSICGVLAIAIPYAGVFAKVYSEIIQEADQKPIKGLPVHSHPLGSFFYGILPVVYKDVKNYTTYRFECALRSSTILGFIGLPTLGFHLETAFREGLYSEAAAILYCFYLLIASLKYWIKAKYVMAYVSAAFLLLSKELAFSWQNFTRFITYDILPWPMRREGFLNGSDRISLPLNEILQWISEIFRTEVFTGILNTAILTQIVLVITGLIALAGFASISRHFTGPAASRFAHYILIVMRTTPEYIMAYIFLQLWGPSMLPAILAIALHNGAILSYLTGKNAALINLRFDAPAGRSDRYFFEVLPRVYGQFLAFLFYRWEIMMRESAILGILGVYTLGFYIDSAISDNKMDKAIFLIMTTALLNMLIDTVSQLVRRRMKISTKLIASY